MSLHTNIQKQLMASLASESDNIPSILNSALRLLSKWRSVLIQNTLIQQQGTVVIQGPMQGLDFLSESAEGCHIAKLLGCYEQPLLPYIQQAIETNYNTILNIGCAEGYYAVGMARHMPNTQVKAYDINPIAQQTCQALAEKNQVADRVSVGALFSPEDFEKYRKQKTLILCDIEGGEKNLLQPQQSPAIIGMDIIVECHEGMIPGITQTMIDRFKGSHQIRLIEDSGQRQLSNMPTWFYKLAHLDQLLAVWEWRSGPTPWLVMKSNQLQTIK